jgi:DNA repair protein RadC
MRQLALDFSGARSPPRDGPFAVAEAPNCYYTTRAVAGEELIAFALELLEQRFRRGEACNSVAVMKHYFTAKLALRPSEVFACLYLDNRHRVIAFEELFFGTIDGCSVHPREVVRRALTHNAAAAIFVHNHPSGVTEPSRADETITTRLKEALALIDVRVLDHFIVGVGEPFSFAEHGKL